ncbi:MAG: hypothetical protein J7507_10970 [Pseudoxanthomonas sp.]|nr:hypothetical protein [Pseudoxanthomonas sp.]
MDQAVDPRLQLSAPGARARTWLLALCIILPIVAAMFGVAIPVLRGQPLDLIAGNLALTLAITFAGAVLACFVLWRVMAWFMDRRSLVLAPGLLEVRSSFYRCRMPLADMKLDQARVVDLDEHTELKTTIKTNGFSIPGFHSGWFLLRNRRRTFVAIADGRRKLWVPGSGRHDLLLEPVDPAALLARLRELAAGSTRS